MRVFGSPFANLNHPFSWYAKVEEKFGRKKKWTYWFNGSQITRQEVANWISLYYRNVKVLEIQPCKRQPEMTLRPVPKEHTNFETFFAPTNQEFQEAKKQWQHRMAMEKPQSVPSFRASPVPSFKPQTIPPFRARHSRNVRSI